MRLRFIIGRFNVWLGHRPVPGVRTVDHVNRNSCDKHVTSLRWATLQESS